MRRLLFIVLMATGCLFLNAQEKTSLKPRPITMAEYVKAKTYAIKDLDNDTYAKFDNLYILDRYESRKPYFVTGDDGLKKRIDLYKLISKETMDELGTVIFYTNEKGKIYTAIQPNFTASADVWNKYFTDIDDINKEEKNYILKLSYILSKEMSFQLFKAMNSGKDMKDEQANYGTDICFPGDDRVAMADGKTKMLSEIKAGDKVITVDPTSKKPVTAVVSKLVQHDAKNYAITSLLAVAAFESQSSKGVEVVLHSKILSATPNHPISTTTAKKTIGQVLIGDEIACLNEKTNRMEFYTVINKSEKGAGVQKVYNMEVNSGSTFIMNGVMVMQK